MGFKVGDLVTHRASGQRGIVEQSAEEYAAFVARFGSAASATVGRDEREYVWVSWGFGNASAGPVAVESLETAEGVGAAGGVERLPRGDRGFLGYGPDFQCTYGTTVSVYESSSAEGPHVWLRLDQTLQPAGDASAHLSEEQARALVARLSAWLADIPERWNNMPEGAQS